MIDPFPGAGQVQLNLFIPMEEVCWIICIAGDGRGFDQSATLAESRAVVLIDFETGRVDAAYNHSERRGYQLGFGGSYYRSAFPTTVTVSGPAQLNTMEGLGQIVDGPGKNSINVFQQSPSQLIIGVEGEVSVGLPGAPSINGVVLLDLDSDGMVDAQKGGNAFPAYEIYQDIEGRRILVDQFEAKTHGYLMDGAAGQLFRFGFTNDYLPTWLGGPG